MVYMEKESNFQLLQFQIDSGKREAREVAELVSSQLDNGLSREVVIRNFQKSIEGTNLENGFVSMLDWSGVGICHPDPQKIGKNNKPEASYIRPLDSAIHAAEFYDLIINLKHRPREDGSAKKTLNSEIIYLYPVKNSDWIIAAHANIDKIQKQIKELKLNFLLIYLLASATISLLALILVRFLGSHYEKALEIKNEKLAEEVLSLTKLNSDLYNLKNQLNNEEKENKIDTEEDNNKIKNRLLTYSKDKLISVRVDEIAFINTEFSLTTITCLDGRKHSSNSSLDELISGLDPLYFFRANRQYIISVKGIYEIFKYGNNQLKIKLNPASSKTIVISKNKVSEFKKWLNY
ncbi:transcriptional regulator [Arenibacter sp. H213]|nr:transcriptional regulator [Arenibacter sp. H213]